MKDTEKTKEQLIEELNQLKFPPVSMPGHALQAEELSAQRRAVFQGIG